MNPTRQTIIVLVLLVAVLGGIVTVQEFLKDPVEQVFVESDDIRVQSKEAVYERAADLVEPDAFINAEPFSLQDYVGEKVILVDFWTYTCVNCQRTLPYINAWQEEYADDGLLIVGVHTPEFSFEKKLENVQRAVDEYSIGYPVVLDNDYKTWNAYRNRYWPRKYLIDIDGFIVYDHIGEGGYRETEERIVEALEERAMVLGEDSVELGEEKTTDLPDFSRINTHEIYLGYQFSRDQFGNEQGWIPQEAVGYALPSSFMLDLFYLDGEWFNHPDHMELLGGSGKVVLRYDAKQVNIVASSDAEQDLSVSVDGVPVPSVSVGPEDIYTVVDGDVYGEHLLELDAEKGFRIYTFTFG